MFNKLDPTTSVNGHPDATVGNFWAWAYSSLAENTTRGVFAEYLVGLALGVTDQARVEWDAADLRYRGQLIEVKSAADQQTWKQDKPSVLRFDVSRKKWWDAETNVMSSTAERPAVAYVFSHYAGPATSEDVLRLDHWVFYPVATSTLDAELGDQKSVGIDRVRNLAQPTDHRELKVAIDAILDAANR